MSRTDKTAPWGVKAVSRPGVTCVEKHNHERGFCDLPALTPDEVSWFGKFVDGRWTCHWTYGSVFHFDGKFGCGCSMCNDQDGRKQKARRSRYAGRREAREGLMRDHYERTGVDNFQSRMREDEFRTGIDEWFQIHADVAKALDLPDGTVVVRVSPSEKFFDSEYAMVETYRIADGVHDHQRLDYDPAVQPVRP